MHGTMAQLHYRSLLPCAAGTQRSSDSLGCIEICQELDLEDIPDEIDLLAVLWGHIRSYHLQFHPSRSSGH
jgi:hypothetical protein